MVRSSLNMTAASLLPFPSYPWHTGQGPGGPLSTRLVSPSSSATCSHSLPSAVHSRSCPARSLGGFRVKPLSTWYAAGNNGLGHCRSVIDSIMLYLAGRVNLVGGGDGFTGQKAAGFYNQRMVLLIGLALLLLFGGLGLMVYSPFQQTDGAKRVVSDSRFQSGTAGGRTLATQMAGAERGLTATSRANDTRATPAAGSGTKTAVAGATAITTPATTGAFSHVLAVGPNQRSDPLQWSRLHVYTGHLSRW